MQKILGNFIQKHPVVVILVIIMITIGFSVFIPRIEFKTDFSSFSPDAKIVTASNKINEYFGENQQYMLIQFTKENSPDVLSVDALKEMYHIQTALDKLPQVSQGYSIVTFIDLSCFILYGKSMINCTDNQIENAISDLLETVNQENLTLFNTVDPNEEIDYKRFPRLPFGKSVDSADIKQCYLSKTENELILKIEVYDLSDLSRVIQPVFPHVNVMEWFVSFDNAITPVEELNISYTLAAHIEPSEQLWEIGKGFFENVRSILDQIKTKTLLNSYKKEAYLWVKLDGKELSLPIKLDTGSVFFDTKNNMIEINVSLEELGSYGISPQIGSYSLPAKLYNFSAGTRYYQTSILKVGGGRITTNVSKLITLLTKWEQKPLLSKVANSLLKNFANLTWAEFDEFYQFLEQSSMMPDTISLHDIESSWIIADKVENNDGINRKYFSIIPAFYQELQVDLQTLVSKDYSKNYQPSSALMILQLKDSKDYDEIIQMNTDVVENLTKLDSKEPFVSAEAAGNGIATAEINKITSNANQIIAPAIFIIIVAVLFFNFRKPSYVILPMLALVVSTIWLFGSMALFGISFNVIAVALIPLILGLGVDYSVHLLHNYRVELDDGKSPGEAIKNSVNEIGTAMFLAMLTTVIAFLSFLTASIPPIREFGILLACGVIFTFITALTLLPSLRYLLDKYSIKGSVKKQEGLFIRNIMRNLSEIILNHQKLVLFCIVLLSIFYLAGATQIQTGYSMNEFAPKDTPSFQLLDEIAQDFPFSSQSQNYILLQGNIATVEALTGIKETHNRIKDDKYIARNKDGSIKTSSIYTYITQAIDNNLSLIETFNINPDSYIPRTDSDVKALYDYLYEKNDHTSVTVNSLQGLSLVNIDLPNIPVDAINGELKTLLYRNNNKYSASVIRLYLDPSFTNNEGKFNDAVEQLFKEINNDMVNYGTADAIATGQFLINLEISNNLTESQIISTIVSIILAALVLIIVYRNAMLGLIALIPVGLSIVWILGTMYYIGYNLNVLTITVTSITIGIGIDYAIHVTERFRYIIDKTGDIRKAVCETISRTGGALLIAALTTALGFIILIFAPIPPQQQFGLILSITIVYSFLTSIFLLPLVLYHWAVRRKKMKKNIINGKRYK